MPWAIFGHASRLQFDAALKAQFRKIARCMHDQRPAAWSSGRVLRSKCCLQLNIELTHRAVVGSDENNWAVTYLSIFSLSYHLDADTHQLIFGHLSIALCAVRKVYFSAQPNNLKLILNFQNTILLNIYLSQLVRVRGKYTVLSFSDFQTLDPWFLPKYVTVSTPSSVIMPLYPPLLLIVSDTAS